MIVGTALACVERSEEALKVGWACLSFAACMPYEVFGMVHYYYVPCAPLVGTSETICGFARRLRYAFLIITSLTFSLAIELYGLAVHPYFTG